MNLSGWMGPLVLAFLCPFVSAQVCEEVDNCVDCRDTVGCNWCVSDKLCKNEIKGTQCADWLSGDKCPCYEVKTCSECLSIGVCGWCGNGDSDGSCLDCSQDQCAGESCPTTFSRLVCPSGATDDKAAKILLIVLTILGAFFCCVCVLPFTLAVCYLLFWCGICASFCGTARRSASLHLQHYEYGTVQNPVHARYSGFSGDRSGTGLPSSPQVYTSPYNSGEVRAGPNGAAGESPYFAATTEPNTLAPPGAAYGTY